MSYQDGWAALHMEMPPRVPRTEYSLEMHPGVIKAITGLDLPTDAGMETKRQTRNALYRALNYDFVWSILTSRKVFGEHYTDMGHAVYQAGAVDYQNKTKLLYEDPEEALRFDPWELLGARDGAVLTEEFNRHFEWQQRDYSNAVAMTGIYVTGMSGMIDLFGWDILLSMAGMDSEEFGALSRRYCDWILQYFEALARCKSPVVMVHDDIVWTSGAFLHPDWYRKYLFPNLRRLLAPLHEAGKVIVFTSDGNFTEFIDDIAACGVNAFVLEPCTDMAYIAEKYGKTHGFIGNADTRILLSGTKDDIYAEVKRCMDIGKSCPGFFMAVGNHIPANTPLDNVLYYNEIYEKLSHR